MNCRPMVFKEMRELPPGAVERDDDAISILGEKW
jgi:hypothetical protein